MFPLSLYGGPIVSMGVIVCLFASVKILRQYERAVVFTLGKFQGVKGPGLVLLIPFIQEMVRVDQRIQVVEIPTQDVISRDNVSMKVDAVLYFRVVDSERAIIQVQDYLPATNMLAQTTLRAVPGQQELDEMLSERKKLSADVQAILDSQTGIWGVKVSNVEIRTVELTENMVRAIAKQAEAERDRRAKIIHAEAKFQASQTLTNAAKILSSIPAAMQLRYLQTLTEIGAEQNSTIVFPMPIDIIKPFLELMDKASKPSPPTASTRPPMRRGTREASGNSDRNFALSPRRALTASAGLVISMARGASGSALGTEFDGFLFASVREDGNGPLSVLSTLARLDVDPWKTAAMLAALPQGDAAQSLASLFRGLPGGLENPDAVAMRLVACLPNRATRPAGGQSASTPMGTGAHAQSDGLWLIYLLSMLMVLGLQGLAQSHGAPPGPTPKAAAISAQAPRADPGLVR